MALLEQDMEKLKSLSTYFNVGEYYGLFACIVTGRSWDSINTGINKTKFTPQEVFIYFF
jgi:aarF domain-containing kinase